MILNAIAEKLKRQSKGDFKGRHFEAWLIVQAVTWYLRYPLSYRDLEEMFQERGFEVDHSTINRWVLAYVRDVPTTFFTPKSQLRTDWAIWLNA
jgi:transposase-like protein